MCNHQLFTLKESNTWFYFVKVLKNIYLRICISSINQPENQKKKGANVLFAFGTGQVIGAVRLYKYNS